MPSFSALLRHASKLDLAAPEPSRDYRNHQPAVLSFPVLPELLILGNLSGQSMRRPVEGLPSRELQPCRRAAALGPDALSCAAGDGEHMDNWPSSVQGLGAK